LGLFSGDAGVEDTVGRGGLALGRVKRAGGIWYGSRGLRGDWSKIVKKGGRERDEG
jgi:hypothetical protein